MTESNPDLDRLCRAAQKAANETGDLREIVRAVLEEMKTPTERINDHMLHQMASVGGGLNSRDVMVTSAGYFGILAAYRGTFDDED
jgi:hypothetical protein